MLKMSFVCSICANDPTSHSFVRLEERQGVQYFYSCPSKATRYDDADGILYHYSGMLAELNGKPWAWIFDSTGFGVKHFLQFQVAIGLAKLISQTYVKKIYIVHPTWHIKCTLNMVWPFLSKSTRECIFIL